MTPLQIRHATIEATMARFRDRPFAWGSVDCAKVAAFHLAQVGIEIRLAKAGSYKTALGGKRALRRLGYSTLPDMADGIGLTPIAPARMLLGDLAAVPGDNLIGTLCLYAGNGNLFGFHEDHQALVTLQPTEILRAWSIL